MQVNAYAAPAEGAPLVRRRSSAGMSGRTTCSSTSRTPASATPTSTGARRLGAAAAIPLVPGPRDRRRRRRGRRRGHQAPGRRPGRRRLHGRLLPRVRQLPHGDEQFCEGHGRAPTTAPTGTARPPTAATPTQVVVDEDFVLSDPRRPRPGRRRAAAVRRHHHVLAAAALGRRAGQEGRRGRPGRARPHGGQARARAGRRGHRALAVAEKQDDGLRLGADHYYATSDAETFDRLAGTLRPDHQHRLRRIDFDAYLGLLAVDGTLVIVGAPAEPLQRDAIRLIGGSRSLAGSMIGGIARDPGDARLLRRARHRRRRSS